MGLNALAIKKETTSLGPNEQVTMRIPASIIALADELAQEFETSQSAVLREMMVTGFYKVETEWQWAHEDAKPKGKK